MNKQISGKFWSMMTLMGALSTIPTKVAFQLNPLYLSLLIPLYFFLFSSQPWATLDVCKIHFSISHHNEYNSEVTLKPQAFLSQIPQLHHTVFTWNSITWVPHTLKLFWIQGIHAAYLKYYSTEQSSYTTVTSCNQGTKTCFLHLCSVHADLITAPPSCPLTSM